jgi:hypothetical protein
LTASRGFLCEEAPKAADREEVIVEYELCVVLILSLSLSSLSSLLREPKTSAPTGTARVVIPGAVVVEGEATSYVCMRNVYFY